MEGRGQKTKRPLARPLSSVACDQKDPRQLTTGLRPQSEHSERSALCPPLLIRSSSPFSSFDLPELHAVTGLQHLQDASWPTNSSH
jgi:hypothetical protein